MFHTSKTAKYISFPLLHQIRFRTKSTPFAAKPGAKNNYSWQLLHTSTTFSTSTVKSNAHSSSRLPGVKTTPMLFHMPEQLILYYIMTTEALYMTSHKCMQWLFWVASRIDISLQPKHVKVCCAVACSNRFLKGCRLKFYAFVYPNKYYEVKSAWSLQRMQSREGSNYEVYLYIATIWPWARTKLSRTVSCNECSYMTLT